MGGVRPEGEVVKLGVEFDGLSAVINDLAAFGALGESNLMAAGLDTAAEAREVLVKATVSPATGAAAKAARFWRIVRNGKTVAVLNANEIAAYLEWGTGIHNEGPGLKDKIRPRRSLSRFGQEYADRLMAVKGEQAPRFLSWIDKRTGKRVFAREVEGMKPVRMVRSNVPALRRLYEHNATEALKATIRGVKYGE